MGGEFPKREGVLFHWWPYSSLSGMLDYSCVYTDISSEYERQNHHNFVGNPVPERCFITVFLHFEGVLLAVRGCTSMYQGVLNAPSKPLILRPCPEPPDSSISLGAVPPHFLRSIPVSIPPSFH